MKKHIFLILIAAFIPLSVNASEANVYEKGFVSYFKKSIKNPSVRFKDFIFLKEGEEPKLYLSDDFKKDRAIFRTKNFVTIGHSLLNGSKHNIEDLKSFAKHIGARVVLYTDVKTTTKKVINSSGLSFNQDYQLAIFFAYKTPSDKSKQILKLPVK